MDKSWIKKSRESQEYIEGVKDFIESAFTHGATIDGRLKCPCLICNNKLYQLRDKAYEHLLCNGFDQNYKMWYFNGEKRDQPSSVQERLEDDGTNDNLGDKMGALSDDTFGFRSPEEKSDGLSQGTNNQPSKLVNDIERALYPGCEKFTNVSFLRRLFDIKQVGGWSDKSLGMLYDALGEFLPEESTLPETFSEAKKLISDLGMDCNKINACPNDCLSYGNECAGKQSSDICVASRSKSADTRSKGKKKKRPTKIVSKEHKDDAPVNVDVAVKVDPGHSTSHKSPPGSGKTLC